MTNACQTFVRPQERVSKIPCSLTIAALTVTFCALRAEVAELVDAPGSGPGGGNTVEVRVLFSAPFRFSSNWFISGASGSFQAQAVTPVIKRPVLGPAVATHVGAFVA